MVSMIIVHGLEEVYINKLYKRVSHGLWVGLKQHFYLNSIWQPTLCGMSVNYSTYY